MSIGGEVTEFIAPVEDPDCVLCRVPPAIRTLAILSGAEFGCGTVVDRHRHKYHLGPVSQGTGGMAELLAEMRTRAKEAED